MERVARHAWLANLVMMLHAEGVQGEPIPCTLFRVRPLAKSNQGLRSFHSLNPWLHSWHPFGVLIFRVIHQVC